MKALLVSMTFSLGLVAAFAVHAQVPAGAPAGSTGLCKDGTYYSGASKKGACRGHQGVKDWYAGTAASNAPAAPAEKQAKASKKDKAATAAAAATPAAAAAAKPADATGLCKDGTYYTGDSKKGACRGHKGVQDWYGATAAPAPAAEKKPAATKADTAAAPAATHTAKPADATGLCKDGTYYTGENKKGACRGHKGVQDWYGAPAATPATPAKPSAPAPAAPAAPPAAAPKATAPTAAAPAAPAPAPETRAPAAGGGNGKVWVNSETKVYHCADDRYYGKTKQGEYMSESDAIAKGARASHGKACAQ